MKKIVLLVSLLLSNFLISCSEKTELELLVKENGKDSAEVYNKIMGFKKKWLVVDYGSPRSNLNDKFMYKQAAYIDKQLAAIEFETENQAEFALNKLKKMVLFSFFQKGKFLFASWTGGYVLAYGLESIVGDGITSDAYIYDSEKQEKTLLVLSCDTKIVDDTIRIEGYDTIASNALYFYSGKVGKLVIGEQTKKLSCASLHSFECEVVEFEGNIKEIGMSNIERINSFLYTVIPASCEYIACYAFNKGNIYCEAKERPNGWNKDFAYKEANVYWADEWEYDENGVPKPIES